MSAVKIDIGSGHPNLEPCKVYDEGNGVFHFVIIGHLSYVQDVAVWEVIDEIAKKQRAQKLPVLLLADLRKMRGADYRARRLMYTNSQTHDFDGLCYVGGNNVASSQLLKLALKLFDTNRFHFTNTAEDAVVWLCDYKKRKLSKDRMVKI
jgi:hypothetical protein